MSIPSFQSPQPEFSTIQAMPDYSPRHPKGRRPATLMFCTSIHEPCCIDSKYPLTHTEAPCFGLDIHVEDAWSQMQMNLSSMEAQTKPSLNLFCRIPPRTSQVSATDGAPPIPLSVIPWAHRKNFLGRVPATTWATRGSDPTPLLLSVDSRLLQEGLSPAIIHAKARSSLTM